MELELVALIIIFLVIFQGVCFPYVKAAKRIKSYNKISFSSISQAIKAGYSSFVEFVILKSFFIRFDISFKLIS